MAKANRAYYPSEYKRRGYLGEGTKLILAGLNATTKPVLDRLMNATSFDSMYELADEPMAGEVLSENIIALYQKVGADYAKDAFEKFKPVEKDDGISRMWMEQMRAYVQTEAGERLTWITHTTEENFKRIVRNVTQEAKEKGWGVEQAGREIRKQIGFTNRYRAVRIARTEINTASNRGSYMGAKSTGLEMDMIWMTSKKPNIRDSHKVMEGVTVGIDEEFNVPIYEGDVITGHELMKHPCDAKATAGNRINCRCTQGYIRRF